jgi:hypothetical protein
MVAIKLIKKFVLLGVLELMFCALIYFALPADTGGYIAAIEDKKLLLINTKSPRIIFVGGSNIAFGLNSELIENELKLPVINFGLHGTFGLKTSLNIVEEYVRKGDIIVLIPEYSYFDISENMYGSDDILADFIEINPANIQYIDRHKWVNLPLIALNILERKIERQLTLLFVDSLSRGVYARSSFNSSGDAIGHLGYASLNPSDILDYDALPKALGLRTDSFQILEEFQQKMINKGGVVLFDFPSFRMQNCKTTGLKKLKNFLLTFKAHTTIPILSTPYDRCYPDNYFFNTEYHLNAMGRLLRTQQVIKSLSLALNK